MPRIANFRFELEFSELLAVLKLAIPKIMTTIKSGMVMVSGLVRSSSLGDEYQFWAVFVCRG